MIIFLFLIGVIFFLRKITDIAKFITAFTIGHSITLIFATFYEITANYYLIDAVIALSVIYKGFENLGGFKKIFKINTPNLVTMVFIFGLIHGFGLSSRLQQLPLGHDQLIEKIISFNLGVEIGQVIILAIIFPLIALLRRGGFFLKISKVINSGLIVAGILLFFFQLYGFFNSKEKIIEGVKKQETIESTQEYSHNHKHKKKEHSHDHQQKKYETKHEKKTLHKKKKRHHHGDGKYHEH